MIEELTGIKERTIIFKITNLANWIGLGVCLKDRILAVNYAFKCMFPLTKMNNSDTAVICCPTTDTLGPTARLRTTSILVYSRSN